MNSLYVSTPWIYSAHKEISPLNRLTCEHFPLVTIGVYLSKGDGCYKTARISETVTLDLNTPGAFKM